MADEKTPTEALRERGERLRKELEETQARISKGASPDPPGTQTVIGDPVPIDPSTTVDGTKVIQWLEKHWQSPTRTGRACLVCGQTKWTIARDFTWMATVGSGGNLQLGGDYYPFVLVICTTCGNTLAFNAKIIGLLPSTKREGE